MILYRCMEQRTNGAVTPRASDIHHVIPEFLMPGSRDCPCRMDDDYATRYSQRIGLWFQLHHKALRDDALAIVVRLPAHLDALAFVQPRQE